MMRSKNLAALIASAAGCALASPALGQSFINGDFETGDFTGWTVTPTFNGLTAAQSVDPIDIDGPGPLPSSLAARFRVGTAISITAFQGGIELWQNVNLTGGTGYVFACDWAALNTSTSNNAEGGVFTMFVENRLLAGTQAAGGTSSTTPHYGHLEGAFGPETSGSYRVGVRVTRPFTTGTTTLGQYLDNFTITTVTVGACCLADGTCFSTRSADCTASGGTYAGDGVACAAAGCAQPGSCCIPDSGCFVRSDAQCLALGGVYGGNGTSCPATGCTAPTYGYAPIANRATDGSGSANTPIINASGRTYQFAIAASELAGIPAGSSLTGLTWRQDNTTANATAWPATDANFGQYDIQISSGAAGPGTMLPTFADNIGTNVVAVRSGALTIPAMSFPGGATGTAVNDFGFVIPFSTPFVYNGGPLVVTIRHSGSDLTNNRLLDAISTTAPSYFNTVQAFSATGAAATSGTSVVFNIVRFAVQPAGNACYANCDGSTTAPVLNVLDFSCFLNQFAAGSAYANCDGSTTPPVLNVLDFSCFLNRFAAGCT